MVNFLWVNLQVSWEHLTRDAYNPLTSFFYKVCILFYLLSFWEDLKGLQNEIKELNKNLIAIKNSIKGYGKPEIEDGCVDNFKFTMTEFWENATKVTKSLDERRTQLVDTAQNLA